MSTASKTGPLTTALALGLALHALSGAHAQTVPDAGQILREQPAPAQPPAARPALPALSPPAADSSDAGPRIQGKGVRITGATLVPPAALESQLADLIDRTLSFGQLQLAALRLTAVYAEHGYLARAFLPPQDVVNGVVEFRVVEGRRGDLQVDRQGERIDAALVQAHVDRRLPQGAPMDIATLGEAMSIVNEQPGADVTVALTAGATDGAVDLRLRARDTAAVTYNLAANNHASRGVGTVQVIGSATLNNPTGRFDAGSLLLGIAEGSAYLRGDYGLPLGVGGTRIKAHAAWLDYRLVQDSFRPLDARGTARTLGLEASHPLARRSTYRATLSGSVEFKQLADRTSAGETGDRRLQIAQVGVSGSLMPAGIPGELDLGLTLTTGEVDQRNPAARAADAAGRRVQGGFARLGLALGWRQTFAGSWVLGVQGRGQWADGNLDSSEQFTLGGIGGVRAYPTGEAVGDEGWLLSVDLGHRLGERLLVGAFIDGGEVTLNHTPAAATPRNRYGLAGAGLSLDWQLAARASLRLMLAAPVGHNPAADISGLDADGRTTGAVRLWASVAAQF